MKRIEHCSDFVEFQGKALKFVYFDSQVAFWVGSFNTDISKFIEQHGLSADEVTVGELFVDSDGPIVDTNSKIGMSQESGSSAAVKNFLKSLAGDNTIRFVPDNYQFKDD